MTPNDNEAREAEELLRALVDAQRDDTDEALLLWMDPGGVAEWSID